MRRRFLNAAAVAVIAVTATACNTVQGLGQDIESVGRAGEEAID